MSYVLTVSVSSNGSDEATHPLSFAGVLYIMFNLSRPQDQVSNFIVNNAYSGHT